MSQKSDSGVRAAIDARHEKRKQPSRAFLQSRVLWYLDQAKTDGKGEGDYESPQQACQDAAMDLNAALNLTYAIPGSGQPNPPLSVAGQPSIALREALAALAHEQWSGWMRYLFSRCESVWTGELMIPREWVERWKRQMETPYADLTEAEQNSDREEADRVLALLAGSGQPSADEQEKE